MKNREEETMIFTPVEETGKPPAQKSEKVSYEELSEEEYEEYEEEGKGKKFFLYTFLILAIIAVIATTLFIVLSWDKGGKKVPVEEPGSEVVKTEDEEVEEDIPPAEITYTCSIIFFGDSAVENNGEYTVTAQVRYQGDAREEKKHLIINGETQIRINEDRLDKESFIYLIEGKNEEKLSFDAKINESGYILSVSFIGEINKKEEEIEGTEVSELPTEEETLPGDIEE